MTEGPRDDWDIPSGGSRDSGETSHREESESMILFGDLQVLGWDWG